MLDCREKRYSVWHQVMSGSADCVLNTGDVFPQSSISQSPESGFPAVN